MSKLVGMGAEVAPKEDEKVVELQNQIKELKAELIKVKKGNKELKAELEKTKEK